jgi:hypothetical protein
MDCADPESIPRNRTAVNSLRYSCRDTGRGVPVPLYHGVCTHTSLERYGRVQCVIALIHSARTRSLGFSHTQPCTHVCTHTVLYTRILTGVPVLLIRYWYWLENLVRILKIRNFLAHRRMPRVRSCW